MATGRRFEITEEQLLSNANFDEIEVPQDYIGVLSSVEDYDSGDERTPKPGWKWTFIVEGLPFTEWTSFATAARWKIVQLIEGMGGELSEGLNDIDPDSYVGTEVGVTINWDPPDNKWDGIETRYKRIERFFPLAELEDLEALLEEDGAPLEGTPDESGMEEDPVGPDEVEVL